MEDNTEETMRDRVEMMQYFPRTVSSQIISEVSTVNVEPISFSMEEVLQDVPNESLQHNEPIDVDLTMEFSTNMVFESRNDLITWARNTGKKIGCIIVIKRSDYAHPGRTPRLLLACERYGKFQPQKKPNQTEEEANKSSEVQGDNNKKRKRKSGTKRYDCPFLLRGIHLSGPDDRWKVSVDCGRHNHHLATHLEAHSYAGRLTSEEAQLTFEMTRNGVRPSQILNVIKERDKNNKSTKQHIYNHRAKLRQNERGGRSQMQYLMITLDENGYYEWNRREKDTNAVTDLFWAHPKSIELVKCFPLVLVMDSTYKTNRYRWPLFEVVGVTSTMKTFSVCFAMFEKEKEDNYHWALGRLHSLLDIEMLPSVIVIDRELALVNGVEKIFPSASRMLCRWHIETNILGKAKKLLPNDETWKSFNEDWKKVMTFGTVDEYNLHLEALDKDYQEFP